LDYWPLDRIRFGEPRGRVLRRGAWLLLEKVPLFALAAADGLATFFLQGVSDRALVLDDKSLFLRLGNAVVSYAFFVVKSIVPTGLSVIYPWPVEGFSPWQLGGAAFLLLAITAVALLTAKKRPYLIVGWLWYLGLMAPTMQIMQRHTFAYARADRYTYCALVGLTVMAVWAARDMTAPAGNRIAKAGDGRGLDARQVLLAGFAGTFVLFCAGVSLVQVSYWKDSVTLFRHALDVTSNNGPAHISIGRALQNQGRLKEAEIHFRAAVDLRPKDGTVLNSLAVVLQAQGRSGEAETYANRALAINPADADALANLGAILKAQNKFGEAGARLRKALEIDPDHLLAATNLGAVLQAQGRLGEAEACARKALELGPGHVDALYNLGVILQAQARYSEAEPLFRKVLEHDPEHLSALSNLGAALLSQKKNAEAKTCLEKALALKPDHPTALINMGMVLQALGDCKGAKARFLRVLVLKPDAIIALNSLAWIYATAADEACRDGKKAVECAQRVIAMVGMKPDEPHAKTVDILAAAYARDGQFDKAVEAEQKALELVKTAASLPDARKQELAEAFEQRLHLYESRTSYVEETETSAQ